MDYEDDYDDWYDPEPVEHAFCDNYQPHEKHVYSAINGNLYSCIGLTAQELAEWEAYDPGECEHGLRADLCSGPNHYGEWPNW